jgi:hypothetical protein
VVFFDEGNTFTGVKGLKMQHYAYP